MIGSPRWALLASLASAGFGGLCSLLAALLLAHVLGSPPAMSPALIALYVLCGAFGGWFHHTVLLWLLRKADRASSS